MDSEKISKYRAEVIERFINVESLLNAIICQHYFNKLKKSFYYEVLYDEYFSFGLRRSIFKKIIKTVDNKKVNELGRLNTIRNYFSHVNQEFFEITKLEKSNGKLKEKPEGKILDPRNIINEVDFESLYSEFMKMVGGVEIYLYRIFTEKGGTTIKVVKH